MIVQVVARRHPRHRDFDHADRDKNSRLVTPDGRVKVFWRNTKNRERGAVDKDNLTDYIPRSAKMCSPVAITQNQNRIRVLCRVVLWSKTPNPRPHYTPH